MATHPQKANPINTINKLYTRGLAVMAKEMDDITAMAAQGGLSERRAKDLRDYLKLLKELKAAHLKIQEDQEAAARLRAKETTDADLANKVLEAHKPR